MGVDKNDIDSMYGLALTYKIQVKYDLAEKYFLMAIDKNHVASMYNLALMYNYQEKYELAEKYFLMAALNGNKISQKKINKILHKNFDIESAMKAKKFLDDKNTQIIDKCLNYFRINKEIC
jgi:TPR repeat protein